MNGMECDHAMCIYKEDAAKALSDLEDLGKATNQLYQALIKPRGLRLRLLKWLFPEIVKVADSLRECYWN